MKIGILYICTGKYDRFFHDFYQSSEKFFLPNHEKTYYVWTDSNLECFSMPNVVKTHQPKLGWPHDTLMRFHMFLNKKNELIKNDFLFFFNANMLFLEEINEEILPNKENNWLSAVLHSSFINGLRGTFENRSESTAYIKPEISPYYFQGCLFGGRTKEMINLFETCMENINLDLSNDIIAVWHDESHMNKYFSKIPPKKLHPGYAYPEMLDLNYKKLILQLEKLKISGGHNYLRS